MPRGGPDWGNPDYVLAGVQVDVADVADRLLGFARIDSRGRVAFLDTFGSGRTSWGETTSGAGVSPDVVSVAQFSGPDGLVLRLDSGATIDGTSAAVHGMWFGSQSRIGVEAMFAFAFEMPSMRIEIDYKRVGGVYYRARVTYNISTGSWVLGTPDGDVVLVTHAPPGAGNWWNTPVKIVGDFEEGRYVRFLLGDVQYDISDHRLYDLVGLSEGQANINIIAVSSGPNNDVGYCDYVIVTKDEP